MYCTLRQNQILVGPKTPKNGQKRPKKDPKNGSFLHIVILISDLANTFSDIKKHPKMVVLGHFLGIFRYFNKETCFNIKMGPETTKKTQKVVFLVQPVLFIDFWGPFIVWLDDVGTQ